MFTKKKAATTDKFSGEYSGLDKETIAAIPDIRHDVRLVEIDEQVRAFRAQAKEVEGLLSGIRNYPSEGSMPAPVSAEADARLLLGGASKESLAGPDSIDKRRNLLRQKAAVEMAITILESERLSLLAKLCSAACIEIEPLAKERAAALFAAYENLGKELELSQQFYQLLQRKGIEKGRTPAYWCLTTVDLSILSGGNGLPGLGWYLASRRKFWGLEGQ